MVLVGISWVPNTLDHRVKDYGKDERMRLEKGIREMERAIMKYAIAFARARKSITRARALWGISKSVKELDHLKRLWAREVPAF